MTTGADNASVSMLAQLLTGIQHPSHLDDDSPTFSASVIQTTGTEAQIKIVMPSGDQFLVRVEWLKEESP